MYSVTISNVSNLDIKDEIHSPYVDLKLSDAKIIKQLDAIDSFSFSIYPDNPGFDSVKSFKTHVEVFNTQNNELIFSGRILKVVEKMSDNGVLTKEVACESDLAYLHDSIQGFQRFNSLKECFEAVIAEHNSQTESYKHFNVGIVDVPGSDVCYTSDEESTFDTLKKRLIENFGGELQVRYENGIKYIDYLIKVGQKGNQSIEIAQNLLSISKDVDPTDIISVLKPLGKQLDSADNSDQNMPRQRVDITSVNNGSPYLINQPLIDTFGVQTGVQVFDDIESAAELKSAGQEFLNTQKAAKVQYQIDAVDLALINLSVDNFKLGWTYHVYNQLMSIDEDLRVIGLTVDLTEVQNSSLTIGDKFVSDEEYRAMTINQLKSNVNVLNLIDSQGNRVNALTNIININESTSTSDLNELTNRGYYQISSSHLNMPTGFTGGLLNVISTNEMVWQNLQEINGNQYARVKNQDTWSIWRKNAWEAVN